MLDANKLQQAVDQAYTQFHSLNGGQNADYISLSGECAWSTGGSGYRDLRWQGL
ncbi:hypothetical protein VEE15_18690 [Escherichia coli]|nr:hypothetical protein VEE15_18690 [Escherichia coli]